MSLSAALPRRIYSVQRTAGACRWSANGSNWKIQAGDDQPRDRWLYRWHLWAQPLSPVTVAADGGSTVRCVGSRGRLEVSLAGGWRAAGKSVDGSCTRYRPDGSGDCGSGAMTAEAADAAARFVRRSQGTRTPTRAAAKTTSLPVWGWLERISRHVSTRDFIGLRLALAANTRPVLSLRLTLRAACWLRPAK